MKKTILSLLAWVCAMSLQAETRVTAELKDATVFLKGAELTHLVSFPVVAGDQEVVIDGLSPVLQQNSLQITLTNGMVITSYTYETDFLTNTERDDLLARLEAQCKLKEDSFTMVVGQLNAIKQAGELLAKGIEHSMESKTGEQNITALLSYYQKEQSKLQQQQLAAEHTKARLKDEVNALNKQILEEMKPNSQLMGMVRLKINSPVKKQATAQIKYFTREARWDMTYDIHVEPNGKPLSLLQTAEVSQTTGLDWKNVHLTLSTLVPNKNNRLPELNTWRLNETFPVYGYSAKNRASEVAGGMKIRGVGSALNDACFEEEEVYCLAAPTIAEYTTQNEQQLALEYNISIPYTIEGNGKEEMIALEEKNVPNVLFNYAAVPSQDAAAFYIAEIQHWAALNLLDGKARITYDGTFYGETHISNPADDCLRLTLGTDKQIVIRRELTTQNRKNIGSNTTIARTYTITVRNNKSTAVTVSIDEPYPVSANDKIKVELNAGHPTKNNTEKGILTYMLDLQPNESKTITVSYTVKHPKDMRINL